MIQFHPTGLVIPGSLMTGALLEEGLRGAGGQLRNGLGERFMARYDPAHGAVHADLSRGRRIWKSRQAVVRRTVACGSTCSHLGAAAVERSFRGMVRRCRDFGRDLAREPVEVAPTAHFMMGGVVIDAACRTTIDGLYAAGEDAGGVHGANRLGGNGVADSTVFGGIAGDTMAADLDGRPRRRRAAAAARIGARGPGAARSLGPNRTVRPSPPASRCHVGPRGPRARCRGTERRVGGDRPHRGRACRRRRAGAAALRTWPGRIG